MLCCDDVASVARRALQLAAGLLLLVGLLGLSTALVAEVREEVIRESQRSDQRQRQIQDPDVGLPVRNLTLLDPTTADAPQHERDGSRVTFTGAGQLKLDPGEAIRPGPVPLGSKASVELGEGSQITGERITCPNGCKLDTGSRVFPLPPNASVVPPGPTSLLDVDGVPEPGTSVGLPTGSMLHLPVVEFPAGTQFDLNENAFAEVPAPTQRLAQTPNATRLLFPPGTIVTRAPETNTTDEALENLLQRGRPQRSNGTQPGAPQQPSIEVTDTPDTIEKGQPFRVAGVVHGPEGERIPDHPVTIYANATKQRPGFEIQQSPVRTDSSGVFAARAMVPEDKPTRPYHIVARSHADPEHKPPLGTAWSDPVVNVSGEAEIDLSLPVRAGVRVPLTLEAHLRDGFDAPIPNQTVVFQVQGLDDRPATRTNRNGNAIAVLESGLPFPGNYTVEATFRGTDGIAGAQDTDRIRGIEARIETNGTHRAPRGGPTGISGQVVAEEGNTGRIRVTANYHDNITAFATTDEDGRFDLELPVPGWLPPGNHSVRLKAGAVDATHRLVLTATAGLTLDPPNLSPQPVGGQLPLKVQVRSDNGTAVPGIRLHASQEDVHLATDASDSRGVARLNVPIIQEGRHQLMIQAEETNRYRGTQTVIPFESGPLQLATDLSIPPGERTNGSVRLSVLDQPLQDVEVQLVGPGIVATSRTDDDGVARLPMRVPSTASPGERTANLSLPGYRVQQAVTVHVLDSPTLELDLLSSGQEGRPIRLGVTAVGALGPLPGVPLIAHTTGAFETSDQAVTAENGTAVLTLERPEDIQGSVTITVEAEPTQRTAGTATVASTDVTAAPLPWGWIVAGLAALGIVGTVVLRRGEARGAESLVPDQGPHLSLAIPPQREGLPPVWHPGEGTQLLLRLTDENGEGLAGREVHVDGPPGHSRVEVDENGSARLSLPAHGRGTQTYTARFGGDGEHEPAETVLELRIIRYREEIDREYRKLRDEAYRMGLVGSDATPRELARALDDPAHELARLFERCDYSPRPVEREHYERFMRAKEAVRPDARRA